MSLMDSVMADDFRYAFADSEAPGAESVVYNPHGGTPRTITAQVWRDDPDEVPEARNFGAGSVRVAIANHATLGTTSVNMGGDTITLAGRRGGTASVHQIVGVIKQDAGGWMLRLRGKAK